jgi:hypothetical protein
MIAGVGRAVLACLSRTPCMKAIAQHVVFRRLPRLIGLPAGCRSVRVSGKSLRGMCRRVIAYADCITARSGWLNSKKNFREPHVGAFQPPIQHRDGNAALRARRACRGRDASPLCTLFSSSTPRAGRMHIGLSTSRPIEMRIVFLPYRAFILPRVSTIAEQAARSTNPIHRAATSIGGSLEREDKGGMELGAAKRASMVASGFRRQRRQFCHGIHVPCRTEF